MARRLAVAPPRVRALPLQRCAPNRALVDSHTNPPGNALSPMPNIETLQRGAGSYAGVVDICLYCGVVLFLLGFYVLPDKSAVKTVFYLLVLLPCLLKLMPPIREGFPPLIPPVTSALAFCLYMATTLFWGADDWQDSWFHFYKQVIAILAWLTACIWVARNAPALFDMLPRLIVWTGTVVTAITMAAYFSEPGFPTVRMSGLGAIDNELIAAQCMGSAGILGYGLGKKQFPDRTFNPYFAVAAFTYCGVLLTQSRGPIAYMPLVLLLALFLYRPSSRQLLLKFGAGALLLLALVALNMHLSPAIEQRGLSYRDVIWKHVFAEFSASPIRGIGISEHARVIVGGIDTSHSHNAWLDIMRFGGLIGLGLSLWHLAACLRHWRRYHEYTHVYLWFIFGCLSAFTNGKCFLSSPGWIWLYYWMPAGLICGIQASRQSPSPAR